MGDESGPSGLAVVLDTGSGLVKAGLSGDGDGPSRVFPSVVGHAGSEDVLVGEEALGRCGGKAVRPVVRGVVANWTELEKLWDHAFFSELRVNPTDHPVLVTETPLNPKSAREKLVRVLFETYEAPSAHVACQAVLSLYAAGRVSGLVLDCGDGVSDEHLFSNEVKRTYMRVRTRRRAR
eukprot:Gregarina_sp_Pseudo_9__5744@NODE_840_length_2142_cov_8_983833_g788_i0_p2_GENE_NODE_840_length_2142_cov_8_983833_g788_i0NODE_840_length_2142_cov_8_983833_g788_i0_p2_ORF_typecomplete_len179_score50_55Actin/PF00022_19/6_4e46MreB_Mbl/PF06723_13/0_0018_NODE_840_length_2142_cov_8_983833_g788_i014972033